MPLGHSLQTAATAEGRTFYYFIDVRRYLFVDARDRSQAHAAWRKAWTMENR
jgi:hypothetical protein